MGHLDSRRIHLRMEWGKLEKSHREPLQPKHPLSTHNESQSLGDLHAASGVTIPAGFRRRKTVLRKAEQPSPPEAEGREAAIFE
ncbi:hypothetical protein MTO96_006430 [Rhipicephalus appendiculatus]